MKRKLAIALAVIGLASVTAQLRAATMPQELDIAWLKDGQQIQVASHLLFSDRKSVV